MHDAKMTIRLPASNLEFAKSYAQRSGFSLTSLFNRYLMRLQSSTEGKMPEDINTITGLVPPKVDASKEYHAHRMRKT